MRQPRGALGLAGHPRPRLPLTASGGIDSLGVLPGPLHGPQQSGGASGLNVSKATGPADHRPTVTEKGGPAYGYHVWDLSLAQDNLVSDVAAAEITWTHDHR